MEFTYSDLIEFTSFYPYFFHGVLVISTPLFFIGIYIFAYHTPKELRDLKRYGFNFFITNYLVVIFYNLFQPVVLFPLPAGFSRGIFRSMGPMACYISLDVGMVLTLNMIMTYTTALWYQYSIVKGRGCLSDLIKDQKLFTMVYMGYIIVVALLMMTLLRLAIGSGDNSLILEGMPKNSTTRSMLEEMFEHESSSVAYSLNNIYFMIFMIFLGVIVFVELISVVVFNILLLKAIGSTASIVTKKTLHLQMTFYRNALVGSIFIVIFFILPLCAPSIIVFFGIQDFRIGILSFNLCVVSVPLSYAVNLIMVKPYRKVIVNLFWRCFKKNSIESSTTNTTRITPKKPQVVVSIKVYK